MGAVAQAAAASGRRTTDRRLITRSPFSRPVPYRSSAVGHSCAGNTVGLTPDGPYSRERILKLYGSAVRADRPVAAIRAKTITNDNPDLARFVRRARCDAQGHFAFDGLPDGGYFLIAQVAGPEPLALMRHVNLRGGDIEPVPLTMTVAPPR